MFVIYLDPKGHIVESSGVEFTFEDTVSLVGSYGIGACGYCLGYRQADEFLSRKRFELEDAEGQKQQEGSQ